MANEFIISYLHGSQSIDCVELKKAKIKEETLKQIHRFAVTSCQVLYRRIRQALIDYSIQKMLIF